MSYARWGWDGSDVYVFVSSGGIECCGCVMQKSEWVKDPSALMGGYLRPVGKEIETCFTTTDAAVAHMEEHVARGDTVPDNVIPDLERDREENEYFFKHGVWPAAKCYVPGCEVQYREHAVVEHEFQKRPTPEQVQEMLERSRARRAAAKKES